MSAFLLMLAGAAFGAIFGGVATDVWSNRRKRLTVASTLIAILQEDSRRIDRHQSLDPTKRAATWPLSVLPLPPASQIDTYGVLPPWLQAHLGETDGIIALLVGPSGATAAECETAFVEHAPEAQRRLRRTLDGLEKFMRTFDNEGPLGSDVAPTGFDTTVLPERP